MTDNEFKVKFNKLRSQELRIAYLLKGVQKAYQRKDLNDEQRN